jgi:ankyrin repeat protein
MPRPLPARPDLAHLKKQAKILVRSGAAPRLAEAQRMVARDYGFASWTQLKRHVETLTVNPVDALVSAVKANDVDAAKRLLENHAELREVLNDSLRGLAFGATILNPAVQWANVEMIDLLLRFGADVASKSHWWAGGFGVLDVCTPEFAAALLERGALLTVYSASRLGRVADVERLVTDDPTSVHQRGGDGQTPLHVAATVEVARFLVEHGADVDSLDIDHESTPLQYAIRDRQDVARYLVERGARTDILAASALGDRARVQRFLDEDPDSIRVSVTAEYFPMRDPRAGGSIYIWTLGANKTAHVVAREFGRNDVYRLLMSRTPESLELALACEFGDREAVERMLAARPNLAAALAPSERQSLVAAAERNKTDAVRLMLAAGWPVDTRGPRGATALHWAAWHGNLDMVRAILEFAPSLDVEDGEYRSRPLGWAFHGSENGWNREKGDYAATVDALLSAGARPDSGAGLDASDELLDVLRRHGISTESSAIEVDEQVRGM